MRDLYMNKTMAAFAALGAVVATPAAAVQIFSTEYVIVEDLGDGLFSFSQSGFAEGAFISGSFAGSDINGDDQIISFDGEGSDFMGSFSGKSLVSAFSFTNGGFVFNINGSNILGDNTDGGIEGIIGYASDGNTSWAAGPGPFNLCDGTSQCGLIETIGTNVVPEPGSWAMLIAGFGMVGAARRRRRSAAFA